MLGGCGEKKGDDAPTRAGTDAVTLVPSPDATPEERLRKAFLSVDAYIESRRVREGKLAWLPARVAQIPAMPLRDAIPIIKGAQDPARQGRIRGVVVRLLAHTPRELETREAVKELLGAQPAAELFEKVKDVVVENHEANPDQLVSEAYALVMGPTPLGTCADWKAWADDDESPDSDDISLVVTAQAAPSSMQNLEKGLDPQSWASCSSLWSTSDLVQKNSNGTLTLTPKPLGTAWGAGTLHEHFVCDKNASPPPCDVELLLGVNANAATVNKYDFSYGGFEYYPAPPTNPNAAFIVTDRGWLTAIQNLSGKVDISSTKIFGFKNPADSLLVLSWLYFIEAQTYLGQLACCF
jgi:hypothetical protein